jgi:hypothetical protein
MRAALCFSIILAVSGSAAAEPPLTIERLLADGWEIAGFASGYDNRTSLIRSAIRARTRWSSAEFSMT